MYNYTILTSNNTKKNIKIIQSHCTDLISSSIDNNSKDIFLSRELTKYL